MSNIFDCGIGLLALCVAASAVAPLAVAAEPTENEVAVHHVRLRTHEGEKAHEIMREILLNTYQVCAVRRQLEKLDTPPLAELPKELTPGTRDIYYASNRTLTIDDFDHYEIDRNGDCRLLKLHSQTRHVYSHAGGCDMYAEANREKRAVGVCDMRVHERAPAEPLLHRTDRLLKPDDLSPMPPQYRSEFGAGFQQSNRAAQRVAAMPTGATKTVAGLQCEIYRSGFDGSELCIAKVTDKVPAPASPGSAGWPGVRLSSESSLSFERADSVELNTVIPHGLFEVPPGFKIRNLNFNLNR